MTDELTLAAEAYAKSVYANFGNASIKRDFCAGARWALESEAVAGLVVALERIRSGSSASPDEASFYRWQVACDAVARWNEMRGEK